MRVGCAVQKDHFTNPQHRDAINSYFDTVITEDALVWVTTRPTSTTFNFADADTLVSGALANGKAVHAHALLYHGQVPAWLDQMTTQTQAIDQMTLHISTVVTRYIGKIATYNVVNEFLHDFVENGTDLRPTIWQRLIGNDYIERALRLTHQYDPSAQLVLSEFDFEFKGVRYDARRAAMLRIVRDFVARGVPLHAVGLQGHLLADRTIDHAALKAFVREIHSLGLKVIVTELDIIDQALPSDVGTRDRLAAGMASQFLNAIQEGGGFNGLLTWGVSDPDSWINWFFPRNDGLPVRPLALDASFQPKPLMDVVKLLRSIHEW